MFLSLLSAWWMGVCTLALPPFYEAAHQQIPIFSLQIPEENSPWGGDKCLQEWEVAMEVKDKLKDSFTEKSKGRHMVQVKRRGGVSWLTTGASVWMYTCELTNWHEFWERPEDIKTWANYRSCMRRGKWIHTWPWGKDIWNRVSSSEFWDHQPQTHLWYLLRCIFLGSTSDCIRMLKPGAWNLHFNTYYATWVWCMLKSKDERLLGESKGFCHSQSGVWFLAPLLIGVTSGKLLNYS